MIEAGDAASALPLARRTVERVTAALAYTDDSSGIVGDDLRTLMALCGRACRAAPAGRDEDAEKRVRQGLAEYPSGLGKTSCATSSWICCSTAAQERTRPPVRRESYEPRSGPRVPVVPADRASGERPSRRRDPALSGPDRDRAGKGQRQVPLPQGDQTIKRLRDAYHRAGDEASFTAYLDGLRQRHRRETSFITKLDKALLGC
jgi:hypothetical protein